jgi:hypothetical protein
MYLGDRDDDYNRVVFSTYDELIPIHRTGLSGALAKWESQYF